jgi:hypothetical protein
VEDADHSAGEVGGVQNRGVKTAQSHELIVFAGLGLSGRASPGLTTGG